MKEMWGKFKILFFLVRDDYHKALLTNVVNDTEYKNLMEDFVFCVFLYKKT